MTDVSVVSVDSRYHYPVPKIFYVQLSVGSHEFIGEGRTRQAARHNAAMKALQALRNEPIPNRPPQVNTNIFKMFTEWTSLWLYQIWLAKSSTFLALDVSILKTGCMWIALNIETKISDGEGNLH